MAPPLVLLRFEQGPPLAFLLGERVARRRDDAAVRGTPITLQRRVSVRVGPDPVDAPGARQRRAVGVRVPGRARARDGHRREGLVVVLGPARPLGPRPARRRAPRHVGQHLLPARELVPLGVVLIVGVLDGVLVVGVRGLPSGAARRRLDGGADGRLRLRRPPLLQAQLQGPLLLLDPFPLQR